jgi:threonine dehydrogenase-like Zn-dependent dehydrogenase
MPGMKSGDILGHEFMGVVEEVGPAVKEIQKGQRVVVSFDIACGECAFCMRKEFSACCVTNPSDKQEPLYGTRTSAIFGYSHLTGGIAGGQAEFVRVPFADTNCLPIPDELPDIKALYLSDIIPTSYHGTELGNVSQGDTVAIWGLGPVGLLTALWCKIKGASVIVGIDNVPERLEIAKHKLGIEVIDFSKEKVVQTLLAKFPVGVDVAIECAGFEYSKTLKHKIERTLMLETDSADIFEEMFQSVRCFGRVAVIGVYAGYANHFPVGAMMEKDLTVRCGQCPVQRYWKKNLEHLLAGEFDPAIVVTTKGCLSEAPALYKKFQERKEGTIKVFLRPDNCPDSLKH